MAEDATTIVADEGADKTADTGTADTGATTTADTGTTDAGTADKTATAGTTADDWRSRLSGGDEKLLGYLGRYQSEKAFVEAAKKDREVARKAPKPLGDDPTDEELAAYRETMGVPAEPAGYLEKLPDGLVVGEDDKPYVDKFVEQMHSVNAPKGAVDAALSTYYSIVEEQMAEEAQVAEQAKQAGVDALREEWGPDYRRNLNVMHSHLETLPDAVREAFVYGKGADGIPLGYKPEVLKWLTGLALEQNPLATVVPGAGANQAAAVADELANIEKMMGDTNSDYWKGPKSQGLQARYRQLLEAKDKIK